MMKIESRLIIVIEFSRIVKSGFLPALISVVLRHEFILLNNANQFYEIL